MVAFSMVIVFFFMIHKTLSKQISMMTVPFVRVLGHKVIALDLIEMWMRNRKKTFGTMYH